MPLALGLRAPGQPFARTDVVSTCRAVLAADSAAATSRSRRAVAVDSGMSARLRRQLSRGEVVLFTGAGFSRGAEAKGGGTVAGVLELKQDLWRLAFPSDAVVDGASTLGDVFDVALQRARNAVGDVLNRRLGVDPVGVPDRYRGWFSLPWYRHYTLNLDDLDEVVASHFQLPRDLRSLCGSRDGVPVGNALLSIHLNGRLRDFPEVTFSGPQYGQRLATPEIWYQALATDLVNHPVLFVGTVLEEPLLWQHIEMRRQRGANTVEMRPPSYLVTPCLPPARAALLKRYNVDWIAATEEEFYEEVLAPARAEAELGQAALSNRFMEGRSRVSLRQLSDLRKADSEDCDAASFLLGREPVWADLTQGFAITRAFEKPLLDDIEAGSPQVVLLTGTAATGKSTTAMRLALALEARGRRVSVLNPLESQLGVGTVAAAVRTDGADVVLIDNLDVFGDRTARLLTEVAGRTGGPLVVAAIRSGRLQGLELSAALGDLKVLERTVPALVDADIDDLIHVLAASKRLGRLSGMSHKDRVAVFREQCGRQLLVAMYRATSGELLQERVHSECADLGDPARLIYGMAAVATAERLFVTRDELVIGVAAISGGIDNTRLNVIQELITRELLLSDQRGLRLRHRWIAETALEFYQSNGLIGPPLRALAIALATKADPQIMPQHRQRRLLNRLINHDYLQRMTTDISIVREIYASIEDQLAWDYHYWLQRGSFEVETGDLAMAEVFLNAAVSLAPETDYKVRTEYAYFALKKASKSPRASGAARAAADALSDLEVAMEARGAEDPCIFHVYGSQGLSWARRAPLLPQDRKQLVRHLQDAVLLGKSLHPRRRDLNQLAEDLKREYLLFAVE